MTLSSPGSGKTAQIGKFDITTGTVYRPRRVSLDQGIGAGSRVRVTQPGAHPMKTARRTPSVGMGGALSQRREF